MAYEGIQSQEECEVLLMRAQVDDALPENYKANTGQDIMISMYNIHRSPQEPTAGAWRTILLTDKIDGVKGFSWSNSFISQFGISTATSYLRNDEINSDRTLAAYSIFKGKAALFVYPISPTFSKMDSGTSLVDRRGAVMLKFMPAIGPRKYDSERKQLFAFIS